MTDSLLDIFISYASEDRPFASTLAETLRARDLKVWFDEHELLVGQSLREQIDSGLRRSRFGVVIVSRNFFAKSWPRIELDGLVAMSDSYDRVLPIWLDIDRAYVAAHSPTLAGRRAAVAQVAGDAARVAEATHRSDVRRTTAWLGSSSRKVGCWCRAHRRARAQYAQESPPR